MFFNYFYAVAIFCKTTRAAVDTISVYRGEAQQSLQKEVATSSNDSRFKHDMPTLAVIY
jgi:hypothetical protein